MILPIGRILGDNNRNVNTVQNQLETLIKITKEQHKSILAASLESKSIWTLDELCSFTGYKDSYIYKLTSSDSIPFHQPRGKKLFFDRDEIIAWIKTKKPSEEELLHLEMSAIFEPVKMSQ